VFYPENVPGTLLPRLSSRISSDSGVASVSFEGFQRKTSMNVPIELLGDRQLSTDRYRRNEDVLHANQ
jgi:hypothetical protein